MSDLLPCPFCTAALVWSDTYGEYHHPVAKCILSGHKFKKGMIGQWNRRALPAVQPAHVNETQKSEHDAANMLTLTAERDRLAAAVDAVMADRKRILEERDRGFVMVMERAERAEAEVARLTALLPHPGETAAEVMWRNFQRGVRLEELAKTAGVTRERARQMVRKAEARGIRYE